MSMLVVSAPPDVTADDAGSKHTIPAIDRMMEVLASLERRSGPTIRELAAQLALPRTTLYRILNTLQDHEVVWRDEAGGYHLGRRLIALAAQVSAGAGEVDLAALCQPLLDRLAAELGEGCKLSVVDRAGILVIAAAGGSQPYALTVAPGQRMPIHAGAASKLLLAYLPPGELETWLARPLIAYTSRSITDPKRLRSELVRIRRLGWAQDRGENAPSIQAFAAPVFFRDGRLAAALSIPFLAGAEPSRMEAIRAAAIAAAETMSALMPV